ncbi:MAG: hypothetical protein SFU86_20385 [Pirellulaceae bacterium]|nr:hypothetical protein [Pirellulaceae bacterium]
MPKQSWLAGRFVPALFSGGLALALLCLFVPREFDRLMNGLPWRNAIETTATVQSVLPASAEPGTRVKLGEPAKAFQLGYVFTADGQQLASHFTVSREKLAAAGLDEKLTEFPLFYQPGDPLRHVAFDDPRPPFWSAAQRAGTMVGICALAALGVMIFTFFYRPTLPAARAMPDKLNWPS